MATSTAAKVERQSPIILIASLGNPSSYDGTRHSIGHYSLQKLISELNAESANIGPFKCHQVGESVDFHPIESEIPPEGKKKKNPSGFKPLHKLSEIYLYRIPGYMNNSGKSLNPFYKEFINYCSSKGREPITVLLHDELEIPLAKVKVRKQGAAHKGHNGLRDIQAVIGKKYTGIQLGIGREYKGDKNDDGVVCEYVLSKFTPEQKDKIDSEAWWGELDWQSKGKGRNEGLRQVIRDIRFGKYIYDVNK
ncbi:aminoacyl-tRNA hydrolase [Martiniozyma asiatica (nom. inval.)]|nr:aminoacyl-tRNA hydrolase [Martiniozyma asiatica]